MLRVIAGRRRDPVGLLADLQREWGDVVRVRVGDTSQFIVADLGGVKHVLVDNQRNYTKGPAYGLLGELLGRGLIIAEGDEWKRHRKMVQPSLQPERMRGFLNAMVVEADIAARRWSNAASRGAVVDAFDEMMHVTLRVIARTMLGGGIDGREADVHAAVTDVLDHIERLSVSKLRILELLPGGSRLRFLHKWMARFPTAERRRFRAAIATLDGIIERVIADRRRSGDTSADLVSLLLASRDDQGVALTDVEIRDEVMTMFVAGHETTATALAWAIHELSRHPHLQDAIAAESAGIAGKPAITAADLGALSTSRAVFDETLRLYPPIWRISRFAASSDVIAGYDVPAGSVVVISPHVIHRDPRHWAEPDRFEPSRFAAGAADRPRLAYLPFGSGPRMCPGAAFATFEAQIILSALGRAVRFEPVLDRRPAFVPRVTLRPAGGMPIRLQPRTSA